MKGITKFKVYLEYDPEYGGFIADVPTLPGCMSQGKTEEEALRNIKEAISGYLKVIKKHHRTVPSEKVRYVTVGI
ncbi:MAG: type II toxin-antitoxin system HicB family antitoxin [Firmicutes bacterium]|nr:type II toxin-antitoxin system HicB family antitoxin [Bacillota bacterium]